jgi:hypothetical protein
VTLHTAGRRLALALGIASSGCGTSHGTDGFRTSLTSEEARMTIGGSLLWYWNEMPEAEFMDWSTDPGTVWRETVADAELALYQNATTQLSARIAFRGEDVAIDYTTVQLNPGSRIITPPHATALPLDRDQIGLGVGSAPLQCSLVDTRLIVALSAFPDGPDAIMAAAKSRAAAAGKPEPQGWSDVVHDREMFYFLFREHSTVGLATSTFAYVSVYMLPTCADRRLFFVAEADLIGPVVQVR